jgi:hypothetical protein
VRHHLTAVLGHHNTANRHTRTAQYQSVVVTTVNDYLMKCIVILCSVLWKHKSKARKQYTSTEMLILLALLVAYSSGICKHEIHRSYIPEDTASAPHVNWECIVNVSTHQQLRWSACYSTNSKHKHACCTWLASAKTSTVRVQQHDQNDQCTADRYR